MAIIGPEVKDIWVAVKDMLLFFIGYTLFVFMMGQWYTLVFTRTGPPRSDLWWYPTYLLILVLIAKIIADVFIKPGKKGK